MDSNWSGPGQGQVAGPFECGNETSGSIKYVEFWLAENVLASQEGLCSIQFSYKSTLQ
jgi:hypothetical protein